MRRQRSAPIILVMASVGVMFIMNCCIGLLTPPVGVVLNVLVTGLTGFLYGALLVPNEQQLNQPERFGRIQIPLLSEIPIIGPVLFNQTFIVYLMFIAVALGGIAVTIYARLDDWKRGRR